MNSLTSISPGKLIITGEHSVVYGEAALIGAIDLYTTCNIDSGGKDISVSYINFNKRINYEIEELRNYWRKAGDAWNIFSKSDDDSDLRLLQRDKYLVVKLCLGLVFDELGVCSGINISIKSDIPVGSGLGSSASVAASIIGGLGEYFEARWSLEELSEKVYMVEKIIHGNPSGGDNSAVVYGGLIEYRKVNGKPRFENKSSKGNLLNKIFIIQSGKPIESTGEMVTLVAERVKNKSKLQLIKKIGRLSGKIINKVDEGIDKELIKENNALLSELGVVGDKAGKIIKEIEVEGGAAKVCGAGGVKKGSGILMVFHKDEDEIKYIVDKHQAPYYKVNIGVKGWQIK